MRKITLLLSFVLYAFIALGQNNLVDNPSFEGWTDGKPNIWYLVSSSVTGSVASLETTVVSDALNSFKIDATGASGTVNWAQSVPVVAGKTYSLSMSYYILSGDGTDARIWCNFKTGTTYFAEANLVATGLYSKLRGPGCENSNGSAYFPDEKSVWKTYSTDITIPANVDGFDFQFRTYRTAVVIWDNFSLTEKTTGLTTPSAEILNVSMAGKTLTVTNSPASSVDVFNTMGVKAKTAQLINGAVDLDLPKGIYIVRAGNKSAKIRI